MYCNRYKYRRRSSIFDQTVCRFVIVVVQEEGICITSADRCRRAVSFHPEAKLGNVVQGGIYVLGNAHWGSAGTSPCVSLLQFPQCFPVFMRVTLRWNSIEICLCAVRALSLFIHVVQECTFCFTFALHFALRPQKRGCLLGTVTGGRGGGGGRESELKVRPWIPPEKDRRDSGPPPEQWKC